DDRRDGDFGWR
ncbi:unnamed protein product, partial [Allacma fusca]